MSAKLKETVATFQETIARCALKFESNLPQELGARDILNIKAFLDMLQDMEGQLTDLEQDGIV